MAGAMGWERPNSSGRSGRGRRTSALKRWKAGMAARSSYAALSSVHSAVVQSPYTLSPVKMARSAPALRNASHASKKMVSSPKPAGS
jgi:hypothetical protein